MNKLAITTVELIETTHWITGAPTVLIMIHNGSLVGVQVEQDTNETIDDLKRIAWQYLFEDMLECPEWYQRVD